VAGLGQPGPATVRALADWRGGSVAREAKALAPSRVCGAEKGRNRAHSSIRTCSIMRCAAAIRLCACRSVGSCGGWRRIVPHRAFALPGNATRCGFSTPVGWRPNVHLGTGKAKNAPRRPEKTAGRWLLTARRHEKAVLRRFQRVQGSERISGLSGRMPKNSICISGWTDNQFVDLSFI